MMELRKTRLPKNIKAKVITVVELSVTCSCCKQKVTWTDKRPNFAGGYDAEHAVRFQSNFTTIKASRDARSSYSAEFLLCFDCNAQLQNWMNGKAEYLPGEDVTELPSKPTTSATDTVE